MTDDYQHKLAAEAELWGTESARVARETPPDWRYHRHLRHNVIIHAANIDTLLRQVHPGMAALELGCASGWLTLALAQQGAHAVGLDISDQSLAVARAYYEQVRASVTGTAEYRVADLNALALPAATYDLIVVKATLHHLVNLEHTIDQIDHALKPGGLLWVSDAHGDEHLSSVLAAGALTVLLPTQTSYADKFRALRKFGLRAPSRVKASIEAEGLSPFEGAGREHDWLKLIEQRFIIERRQPIPVVTGYVTAQLKAPDALALPFLKGLRAVDRLLMRAGLLHSTGLVIYARKPR